MLNKKSLFLFLVLILSVTQLETLEAEYKKLCSYDSYYCSRLKSDDEFREPEPSLVSTLEIYRQDMLNAAKVSGIDPRAIAGAILTENTLNVNLKDTAQSFLVSMGLAKDGKFLGKGFSYGFGQIKCERAWDVEKATAKMYSRPERTQGQVCQALLDPKETIKYIGVIIRDAVDTYKENGIDISGDIGVQTTLYNLGNVKQRALAAKTNNALPRVNFFGFFTNMHLEQLGKITTVNTAIRKSEFKDDDDYDLVDGINASLDLKSKPPFCDQKIDGEIRKAIDIKTTSIKSETGPIQILNRYLDCDSRPWVLIKDSKNNEGWVKESDLEKKTTKFAVQDSRKCDYEEPTCVQVIKEKNKYNIHSVDKHFDGVVFSINGGGKASNRGLSKYNPDCILDSFSKIAYGHPNQLMNSNFPSIKLTTKEVLQLRQKLNDVLKRNSDNSQVFNSAINNFYSLFVCDNNCYGNYNEINDYLSNDNQSNKAVPIITSNDYKIKFEKLIELSKSCGVLRGNNYHVHSFYMENSDLFLNYKMMSVDFLNKIIDECNKYLSLSDEDKKSVNLYNNLKQIKASMNISQSENKSRSSNTCSVNLFQTLSSLSSFLTTKCVDKVYIPDQTMFTILNNIYPGKVGFTSSPTSDRYTVTFRETCQGVNKVIKELNNVSGTKKAN